MIQGLQSANCKLQIALVPTLRVGTQARTLRVPGGRGAVRCAAPRGEQAAGRARTQSVHTIIPTRSVGTRARTRARSVGTRAPSGFSLLEVILALAILVGAIAVIGELIATWTRAAGAARVLTQAQLLCDSKLNEITAGILIPDPVQGAPIETDMEWLYSIDLFPSDQNGIVAVKVTVYQDLPVERRPVTFSLVRWLQDPGIELPEPEDTSSAGGSSTSGTGSSASQGGSQSTGAAGAGT